MNMFLDGTIIDRFLLAIDEYFLSYLKSKNFEIQSQTPLNKWAFLAMGIVNFVYLIITIGCLIFDEVTLVVILINFCGIFKVVISEYISFQRWHEKQSQYFKRNQIAPISKASSREIRTKTKIYLRSLSWGNSRWKSLVLDAAISIVFMFWGIIGLQKREFYSLRILTSGIILRIFYIDIISYAESAHNAVLKIEKETVV